MSLKGDIIAALTPIAPAAFHEYTGTDSTYITFFFYNERAGLIADDKEITTVYSLQLDVYSKGNLEDKVTQIKAALNNLGYARTSKIELFNAGTKVYRVSMSFSFSK
jgi:hypothetical protein